MFQPGRKRRLIAVELESAGRLVTRAVIRLLRELPDWELYLLHTKPLGVRPSIPRSLRPRVHVRSARREGHRAAILAETAIFVPAPFGEQRLELEARASGAAIAGDATPDDVVHEVRRLAQGEPELAQLATQERAAAERHSFDRVATELDALYSRLDAKAPRP